MNNNHLINDVKLLAELGTKVYPIEGAAEAVALRNAVELEAAGRNEAAAMWFAVALELA